MVATSVGMKAFMLHVERCDKISGETKDESCGFDRDRNKMTSSEMNAALIISANVSL